jgi:hypothetical protein
MPVPMKTCPLAPAIDTIDGRETWLSIIEGTTGDRDSAHP